MFRLSNYNILLNNGKLAPGSAVSQVMNALFHLKTSQTEIYNEFANKCTDPNYQLSSRAEDVLTKLKLIKSGLVSELTKNIYLSAANDQDFSPIRKMIPFAKM